MNEFTSDLNRATRLQELMLDRATTCQLGVEADEEYKTLRTYFLSQPSLKSLLPTTVQTCRDLQQFRLDSQQEGGYKERRNVIYEGMAPVFDALENGIGAPHHNRTTEVLRNFSNTEIQRYWDKALARTTNDPDGAITIARTLLESVCHHILSERGVELEKGDDIVKLYNTAAKALNLAPNQHSEEILKQILGGCNSVVLGLASLRTKDGDAHGNPKPYLPKPRHAELAVNLAGGMALFLIRTLKND